ncbi:MAG: hypothetical protein QOH81_2028 [Sphingomonadales bacterium]|jgi:hypothetical protein|nr:hypothetical protein [Sphingomonadales bacterium]
MPALAKRCGFCSLVRESPAGESGGVFTEYPTALGLGRPFPFAPTCAKGAAFRHGWNGCGGVSPLTLHRLRGGFPLPQRGEGESAREAGLRPLRLDR